MKDKICFIYPSKSIGGAQLLFVRLARHLAAGNFADIAVMDYADGFLRGQLQGEPGVEILDYENKPLRIKARTTVVTPLSNLSDITEYVHITSLPSVRLLFWSIQPRNLHAALQYWGRKTFLRPPALAPLIARLSAQGSILYMDNPNYWGARDLLRKDFPFAYLPIPFEAKPADATVLPAADALYLTWIGRISYEKIYSILHVMDQVAAVRTHKGRSIVFTVIGEGEKLEEAKAYAAGLNIPCRFPGTMTGAALENAIRETEIGLAMGTSALELAARNVPSVLLDYSYTPIPPETRYRWLFETEGFALGQEVQLPNDRQHTLADLLEQAASGQPGRAQITTACRQYVEQNHGMEHIAKKLLEHAGGLWASSTPRDTYMEYYKAVNPPAYRFLLRPAFKTAALLKRLLGKK